MTTAHTTTFSNNLHQQLNIKPFIQKYPVHQKEFDDTRTFKSRAEAEKLINDYLSMDYNNAIQYLDTSSSCCIAIDAANFYATHIEQVFEQPLEHLPNICKTPEKVLALEQLKHLVSSSRHILLQRFNRILHRKSDMYHISEGTPNYDIIVPEESEYVIRNATFMYFGDFHHELNYLAYLYFMEAYLEYTDYVKHLEQFITFIFYDIQ